MTERRKRRTWSDDEKSMIVAQTLVSGVSVSRSRLRASRDRSSALTPEILRYAII